MQGSDIGDNNPLMVRRSFQTGKQHIRQEHGLLICHLFIDTAGQQYIDAQSGPVCRFQIIIQYRTESYFIRIQHRAEMETGIEVAGKNIPDTGRAIVIQEIIFIRALFRFQILRQVLQYSVFIFHRKIQ
ncbi:hypothetical protein D3C87_1787730 [compost metagenome]